MDLDKKLKKTQRPDICDCAQLYAVQLNFGGLLNLGGGMRSIKCYLLLTCEGMGANIFVIPESSTGKLAKG